MNVTRKYLIEAAKDLSGIIDFDIPIDKIEEYDDETIRDEIVEAASVLEDDDKLLETTIDVLEELEIDVPAGIKIIKNKKQEKVEIKKVEKVKKQEQVKSKTEKKIKAKSKEANKENKNEFKARFISLLDEEKHTQKEIKEILINEFSGKSPSTVLTLLSDSKNQKWCPLDKLVIVDDKGIMRFK
jgi:hypothetical protein